MRLPFSDCLARPRSSSVALSSPICAGSITRAGRWLVLGAALVCGFVLVPVPGPETAAHAEPPRRSAPPASSNPVGPRARTTDPLLDRLDALGITDHAPTRPGTSAREGADPDADGRPPRAADLELHLVSDPPGYGLLAARALETGVGTQRGLCRAPCTTFIDPGTYRLVVENRRGRDRPVRGLVPLLHDGELELHIESRLPARVAYWSASLALIAGGLALFIDQRQPVPTNDPLCEINCFHHPARQRALMTVGGLTAMFGGITLRYGLTARDYGRVVFHPVRARRSPLPATDADEPRDAGQRDPSGTPPGRDTSVPPSPTE